jgi:hypothetical protein
MSDATLRTLRSLRQVDRAKPDAALVVIFFLSCIYIIYSRCFRSLFKELGLIRCSTKISSTQIRPPLNVSSHPKPLVLFYFNKQQATGIFIFKPVNYLFVTSLILREKKTDPTFDQIHHSELYSFTLACRIMYPILVYINKTKSRL